MLVVFCFNDDFAILLGKYLLKVIALLLVVVLVVVVLVVSH